MPVTGIAAAPCVGKLVLFGRNCQCGKGSFIFVLIKNFATSFAGIVFLYPGIFAGRLDSAVMLILVFVFNVITQGEGGQPDMLTVYRIGHAQLAVTIVLDEGIETAPLHIGLEHHFALSQIVGVDFENADMLTVCGGIKQEKASIIAYTKERYGDTSYIFVSENNPRHAMQYNVLRTRVIKLIRKEDLRDDNGELFGFGSHMYRHYYCVKLAEMHLDDWTLAKLLGHASIRNVKYYRKMSSDVMANETRRVRNQLSEMILENLDGWEDEYAKVRQNGGSK